MSPKRLPAPPPALPGYRYISLLGSGGFADVYLYEQDRPRRRVAVKVLLSDLRTDGARRAFEAEANLMAQLSSHPYIVTIFEADTTADGHSYLAMEYCSRPSLDVRYRSGRLSVAEALTVGVQVASAVESAHRAGIAHRDIKPANILVTDYNRPALTDFGISGTIGGTGDVQDHGMSVPWSPPEVFGDGAVDGLLADVWSLGATVYTLLAGHSPFVQPGADNGQLALMDRIGSAPLRRTHREDVPDSLELALATAMSKPPSSRFTSAYSFGLTLQRIQTELGFSVTPFEVLDETGDTVGENDGEEATRVRRVLSIDPGAGTSRPSFADAPTTRPATPRFLPVQTGQDAAQEDPDEGRTILRGSRRSSGARGTGTASGAAGADTGTTGRTTSSTLPSGAEATPLHAPERGARPARRASALLAAGVAVVGGIVIAAVASGGTDEDTGPPPGFTQPPADPLAGVEGNVPPPEAVQGSADGDTVTFSWTNPDPRDGDVYRFRTVTVRETTDWTRTLQTTASVPADPSGTTCIDVQTARSNGQGSEPAAACWPEQPE
ncbi:protein kinase domain-containing protein [Arthrobacter bussei]|uniref:non-specific serine/threonine protein kinase n=1 Tax=Arthrobacter bussei TaxID=2594179 RepID=A0A7X1NRT4_9MICC|nr:serine/threonine protein kinase [Arthrobacter bussei]